VDARRACGKSDYFGKEIDLLEFIGSDRDRLVLKPNDDTAATEFTSAGTSMKLAGTKQFTTLWRTEITWCRSVCRPRAKHFRRSRPTTRFNLSSSWLISIRCFSTAKLAQAFTRLSSNELANVTAGGGMVPTFVIQKKYVRTASGSRRTRTKEIRKLKD
jgi:hypothetical protein